VAYTQVTLATLQTALEAKWESSPFWVTAEATLAINEALQWYNLYTGLWRQRVQMPTVAGQVIYSLTSGILLSPARVQFNSRPLAMASLDDLDDGRPEWQSETTDDADTPSTVQLWAPVGLTQLAIWPADADGANSLIIDGVRETPTLAAPGDFIDIDDSEINAILGEALHIATFKDPGRFPRTQGWHQEFLRTVMAHNARLNASDHFRQAAGVDQKRITTPPAA
jgi:hypothetical protein